MSDTISKNKTAEPSEAPRDELVKNETNSKYMSRLSSIKRQLFCIRTLSRSDGSIDEIKPVRLVVEENSASKQSQQELAIEEIETKQTTVGLQPLNDQRQASSCCELSSEPCLSILELLDGAWPLHGGSNWQPIELEEHWTSFVDLQQDLQQSSLKLQQDAIWDLVSTEASYIKLLRVLIELFLENLRRLEPSLKIKPNSVASNIEKIHEANLEFWSNHLMPMLERARQQRQPMDPTMLYGAFIQIRNIFEPYYKYCCDYKECRNNVSYEKSMNRQFRDYVTWCERQKECERLKLTDLLGMPTQRLTKYSILLEDIAKHSCNAEQSESLEQMLTHMRKFVQTVDMELTKKEQENRLKRCSKEIQYFEFGAVVAGLGDECERLLRLNYSHFELGDTLFHCPFRCRRHLLLDSRDRDAVQKLGTTSSSFRTHSSRQGQSQQQSSNCQINQVQIKFKDAMSNGKLEIVLLLFTDYLLVCKPLANKRQQPFSRSASSSRRLWSRTESSQLKPAAPDRHFFRARAVSQSTSRPGISARVEYYKRAHNSALATPRTHSLTLNDAKQQVEPEVATTQDSSEPASAVSKLESEVGNKLNDRNKELAVIRAPYPLERLRMHESKDGKSIICFPLDMASLLPSTPFELYLTVAEQRPANVAPNQTETRGSQRAHSNGRLEHRESHLSDTESAADGLKGSCQVDEARGGTTNISVPLRPAGRLINLIREAQVRHQLAANFHGATLVSCCGPIADQQPPPGASCEHSPIWRTWFSTKLGRQASKMAVQIEDSPDSPTEVRAAGGGSPTGRVASLHSKQSPYLKALLEQFQTMMLYHEHRDQLATQEFTFLPTNGDYLLAWPPVYGPVRKLARASDSVSLTASRTSSQVELESMEQRFQRHFLQAPSPGGSQISVFEPEDERLFNNQQLLSPHRNSKWATCGSLDGRYNLSTRKAGHSMSGGTTHLVPGSPSGRSPKSTTSLRSSSSSSCTSRSSSPQATLSSMLSAPATSGAIHAAKPRSDKPMSQDERRASPRRQMNSLRRQGVITASTDHTQQHLVLVRANQVEFPDSSLNPTTPPSWSQATTMDQNSFVLDEQSDCAEKQEHLNFSHLDPSRATSFELGNLKGAELSVDKTDGGPRSASFETRMPISVTLTTPQSQSPDQQEQLEQIFLTGPSSCQDADYFRHRILSPIASSSTSPRLPNSPEPKFTESMENLTTAGPPAVTEPACSSSPQSRGTLDRLRRLFARSSTDRAPYECRTPERVLTREVSAASRQRAPFLRHMSPLRPKRRSCLSLHPDSNHSSDLDTSSAGVRPRSAFSTGDTSLDNEGNLADINSIVRGQHGSSSDEQHSMVGFPCLGFHEKLAQYERLRRQGPSYAETTSLRPSELNLTDTRSHPDTSALKPKERSKTDKQKLPFLHRCSSTLQMRQRSGGKRFSKAPAADQHRSARAD